MADTTKKKKVKKMRFFKYTYDEVAKGVEKKVNKELLEMQSEGKEIVTTFTNTIGLSPVLYLITVVYIDYVDVNEDGTIDVKKELDKKE